MILSACPTNSSKFQTTFDSYVWFPFHNPPPLPSQSSVVEQRVAFNPSLQLRLGSPQSASSPVIFVKLGQGVSSEAIADFSDRVHIWWGPRWICHLHLGVIKYQDWNTNIWVKEVFYKIKKRIYKSFTIWKLIFYKPCKKKKYLPTFLWENLLLGFWYFLQKTPLGKTWFNRTELESHKKSPISRLF